MNPTINIQCWPTPEIWVSTTTTSPPAGAPTADNTILTTDRTDHTADETP